MVERHYGRFVWDVAKEATNVRKHGVDFASAAAAFFDPDRRIFVDEKHSDAEPRYFCLGLVAGRVLTVRFVYRDDRIRIFGAGWWRRGAREYAKEDR